MSDTDRPGAAKYKLPTDSFFGRKFTNENNFSFNKNIPSLGKATKVVSSIRQKFLNMNKIILSTTRNDSKEKVLSPRIAISRFDNKLNNTVTSLGPKKILPKISKKIDFKEAKHISEPETKNMFLIQKDLHKKNEHKKFLRGKLQALIKNSIVLDDETVEVMVKKIFIT
jgi:hypothetical protein